MRIIGGKLGGIRLNPPTNLPVRPTTDIAKEALFNILLNLMDIDGITCLDLFCGTGNISFELASRGAIHVDAIDIHSKCLFYIKDTCEKHQIETIYTRKADVFKYITSCKKSYDLIFADPPYDIDRLPQLPEIILNNNLLNPGGILVVEHPSMRRMAMHPAFIETRKYGYSSFSFYKQK
ncbi:methyltransferase domain-containing protein [Sphingobacterium olei]|uniref:Methyltransferase domain-containing protein n=1 Tax=Sphingobacterium olei TaxID=2571155 RepID=A0A4U0NGF4_9SPHI|nr:RsmD family RNA methyltransferase [Sphingobacterium olei]TJZ53251.1 methyltransferase domain-containing protein [Sphingobacterium olei]